jgi:hypothetical protein
MTDVLCDVLFVLLRTSGGKRNFCNKSCSEKWTTCVPNTLFREESYHCLLMRTVPKLFIMQDLAHSIIHHTKLGNNKVRVPIFTSLKCRLSSTQRGFNSKWHIETDIAAALEGLNISKLDSIIERTGFSSLQRFHQCESFFHVFMCLGMTTICNNIVTVTMQVFGIWAFTCRSHVDRWSNLIIIII